ncbi:non-canonical purine NTP pyrophosphatase, partial [Mesorhizobium sp.]
MHSLNEQKIVVASHNEGKLREFADLMAPFGFEAKSAKEYGLPEPDETGTTFEENAYIKAYAAAKATGLPALSDDSGLCVDALDGAPGVYTANWAETADGTRDFGMAMQRTEVALQEVGATEPA